MKSNNFYSEAGGLYGPIFIGSGKDVLISDNRISGRGSAPIACGEWYKAEDLKMILNNVQNWQPEPNPLPGHIYLGPYSENCNIVGENNTTIVVDYGTENKVTGVTILEGTESGLIINDAVRKKTKTLPHGLKLGH